MNVRYCGAAGATKRPRQRGTHVPAALMRHRVMRAQMVRGMLAASLTLLCFSLASCGLASPSLTSPVGTWRAVAEDTGILTIAIDGTFAFSGASFDPVASRDDAAGYDGVGRWEMSTSDANVYLIFTSTPEDATTTGTQLSVPFEAGRIEFHDAEESAGIAFEFDR